MVQKTLEICFSETHASGNREEQTKRCNGDNGKGIKGSHKEGTQKQEIRKVHFVCIDGHPPHPKVRVHPGASSVDISTTTSRGMFARTISSVEIMKI